MNGVLCCSCANLYQNLMVFCDNALLFAIEKQYIRPNNNSFDFACTYQSCETTMLHTLHLKNFALVDSNELVLDPRFNVITGETGAGKSLILDALSLAIGGRGGADVVRFGEKFAEIYAHFDTHDEAVKAWFEDNEREFCEGEIVLRRQISDQGRSKAWINGMPASLAELKSLGGLLVNIHSQHAGLELLRPHFAMNWLYVVGGLGVLADSVEQAYQTWQTLIREQKQLEEMQAGRTDRIALLTARLADIEPIRGVDMKVVEAQYDELSNIDALIGDAYQASQILNNDDEASVVGLLGRAMRLCEHNASLSESFGGAYNSLAEAYELIKDTADVLQDYADNESADPYELERLNTLMTQAHRLSSKFKLPIDDLLEQSQAWEEELHKLENLPDVEGLQKQIAKAYEDYHLLAVDLHQQSQAVAVGLCQTLVERLAPLALPNATCQFAFEKLSTPASYGLYDVELLFSANVGMPLLPLPKVASGGELSRMALIMQVMKAGVQDGLPLLVFDEVDVGISGGTAQVVGELLRKLGASQQLIAITHQAQVASCANSHILVKKEHGDKTTTQFSLLYDDDRIYELARMAGGVNVTQETLAHAKSLLQAVKD